VRLADRARGWVAGWWRGEGGIPGAVLSVATAPAEAAFKSAVAVRGRLYSSGLRESRRAPIPVFSVGNVTVGGTGKTPVAAWLARRLLAGGHRPAIVVSGYGTDEIEVHRDLNPGVPVFASRRRFDGATQAARSGADCVVLDDGFQHRALQRDLDIVLIAAERWFEARRMLPRGPWREAPDAIRRADFVLVTRKVATRAAADSVAESLVRIAGDVPGGVVRLASTTLTSLAEPSRREPIARISGMRVIAVSSLADPEPFLVQLREAGAAVEPMSFPDHHPFPDTDVDSIAARLEAGTVAVLTRKEAVKLRSRLPSKKVYVLEQEVEFESGEPALQERLSRILGSRP
jgi:tetraacyldisaccharide 4'-kinase